MSRHLGLLAALFIAGCATVSTPAASNQAASATAPTPAEHPVSPSMQWLYGSGESAASSIQAYSAFQAYVLRRARTRPTNSVVLAEGATLANPTYVPCGRKPMAVILDVDETTIQNLGYEYDRDLRGAGWTEDSWDRWEQAADHIEPMPGALNALRALQHARITVVFNSNRNAHNAAQTERALRHAGFEDVEYGRTLWLMQAGASTRKDGRRAEIAARYCVLAMAGDQLGDFSDLFRISQDGAITNVTQRRDATESDPIAHLWGNGWFILSNPVYGSGLAGTRDEVFPPAVRWIDPGPPPTQ